MSEQGETVSLRITLRYRNLDEFVVRYAENVSSAGLFIRTRTPKPAGTRVRFELLLADGQRALRGEGVVVGARNDDRPGMSLRFNALEPRSEALVDRIVEAHGEGRMAPTPLSTSFAKNRRRSTTKGSRGSSSWRTTGVGGWVPLGGRPQRAGRNGPSPISTHLLPRSPSAEAPPSSGAKPLPRGRAAGLRPWATGGSSPAPHTTAPPLKNAGKPAQEERGGVASQPTPSVSDLVDAGPASGSEGDVAVSSAVPLGTADSPEVSPAAETKADLDASRAPPESRWSIGDLAGRIEPSVRPATPPSDRRHEPSAEALMAPAEDALAESKPAADEAIAEPATPEQPQPSPEPQPVLDVGEPHPALPDESGLGRLQAQATPAPGAFEEPASDPLPSEPPETTIVHPPHGSGQTPFANHLSAEFELDDAGDAVGPAPSRADEAHAQEAETHLETSHEPESLREATSGADDPSGAEVEKEVAVSQPDLLASEGAAPTAASEVDPPKEEGEAAAQVDEPPLASPDVAITPKDDVRVSAVPAHEEGAARTQVPPEPQPLASVSPSPRGTGEAGLEGPGSEGGPAVAPDEEKKTAPPAPYAELAPTRAESDPAPVVAETEATSPPEEVAAAPLAPETEATSPPEEVAAAPLAPETEATSPAEAVETRPAGAEAADVGLESSSSAEEANADSVDANLGIVPRNPDVEGDSFRGSAERVPGEPSSEVAPTGDESAISTADFRDAPPPVSIEAKTSPAAQAELDRAGLEPDAEPLAKPGRSAPDLATVPPEPDAEFAPPPEAAPTAPSLEPASNPPVAEAAQSSSDPAAALPAGDHDAPSTELETVAAAEAAPPSLDLDAAPLAVAISEGSPEPGPEAAPSAEVAPPEPEAAPPAEVAPPEPEAASPAEAAPPEPAAASPTEAAVLRSSLGAVLPAEQPGMASPEAYETAAPADEMTALDREEAPPPEAAAPDPEEAPPPDERAALDPEEAPPPDERAAPEPNEEAASDPNSAPLDEPPVRPEPADRASRLEPAAGTSPEQTAQPAEADEPSPQTERTPGPSLGEDVTEKGPDASTSFEVPPVVGPLGQASFTAKEPAATARAMDPGEAASLPLDGKPPSTAPEAVPLSPGNASAVLHPPPAEDGTAGAADGAEVFRVVQDRRPDDLEPTAPGGGVEADAPSLPTEAPGPEARADSRRPDAEADTPDEEADGEAPGPEAKAQRSGAEAQAVAPNLHAHAPDAEADAPSPKALARTPAADAEGLGAEAKTEAPSPEAKTLGAEAEGKTAGAEADPSSPEGQPETTGVEAETPSPEAETPSAEAEASSPEGQPETTGAEAETPSPEAETPGADADPPSPEAEAHAHDGEADGPGIEADASRGNARALAPDLRETIDAPDLRETIDAELRETIDAPPPRLPLIGSEPPLEATPYVSALGSVVPQNPLDSPSVVEAASAPTPAERANTVPARPPPPASVPVELVNLAESELLGARKSRTVEPTEVVRARSPNPRRGRRPTNPNGPPAADRSPGSARPRIALGLDLGLHWARLGYLEGGELRWVPLRDHAYLPAVVATRNDGQLVLGAHAQIIARETPQRAISPVALVRAMLQTPLPSRLSADDEGRTYVTLGDRQFDVDEVLAAFFCMIRASYVEHFGHDRVRLAVSVAADLESRGHDALRKAGRAAQIEVFQLELEPEAILRAYRLDEKRVEAAVSIDVGLSRLTIALHRRGDSGLSLTGVRHVDGLGARRIDERIAQLALDMVFDVSGEDHRSDAHTRAITLAAAEAARPELRRATAIELRVNLPTKGGAGGVAPERRITLARNRIEDETAELVAEMCRQAQVLLRDHEVATHDVGVVILAGSAGSYPPLVEALAHLFGREPLTSVPPSQALALGLTRSGYFAERKEGADRPDTLHGSIGLALPGGRFRPLIHTGTELPAKLRRPFPTPRDYQSEVEVQLYQGEGEVVRLCTPLGSLRVTGLPKRPRGGLTLELQLNVNLDGILQAQLLETESGLGDILEVATQQTPPERRRLMSHLLKRAEPQEEAGRKGLFRRFFRS